ncbi:MAG: type II toxin-antitoxin system VapC family toxin [Pseudomonadota bacterium]
MNRKRLLDSFALLAYLNQENGFEIIKSVLAKAQKSGIFLVMNEINIGESYYILFRKRGRAKADYFLEYILPGLPITAVANDFQQVIDAARIKAEYSLSFADCFTVVTARREEATIMTGDPEFKKIEHLVEIEWVLA